MQFDLIDIILSLGIVQGLFLSFVIIKIGSKNANYILALILIIASLMLIGRTIYGHYLTIHTLKWLSFADTIIFIFGPLCYLYFRQLIIYSDEKHTLSIFHYFPALIHFIVFFYFLILKDQSYLNLFENGSMSLVFNIVEATGLISNFIYLIKNFKLLDNYRKREKVELPYTQKFLRFLFLFLISIALCLLLWSFSYISYYYFKTEYSYISYHIIWIIIPLFIYVIGYFSLKQPEILRVTLKTSNKPLSNRLNNEKALVLDKKLEEVLLEQKTYLHSDLTLKGLSEKIGATPNELSWLLNKVHKSNFYDFINQYRIKEFLKRIENKEHIKHTILFIATDVGFQSKSTFNKVFKQLMGMTPSQYINNLNNNLK